MEMVTWLRATVLVQMSASGRRRREITEERLTMGFPKKGKSCIARMAFVADVTSAKTIHACPLSFSVFMHTTSMILPNWPKSAYKHFLASEVQTHLIRLGSLG